MLKIDIKIEIFTKQFSGDILLMFLMVMIGVLYVLINYKKTSVPKGSIAFYWSI